MGPLDGAVSAARRALAGTSDLERCLARLAASVGGPTAAAGSDGGSNGSSGGGFGREAAHVVLYEDVARRRVKVLVGAMKDLQALRTALEAFQQVHKKDTKGGCRGGAGNGGGDLAWCGQASICPCIPCTMPASKLSLAKLERALLPVRVSFYG